MSGASTAETKPNVELYTGCLLGGAVGDALGAPIEFDSLAAIRMRFGPAGIQDYAPAYGRVGAITDDTQMTLFTAEGLLQAYERGSERGIVDPKSMVYHAYLRWLQTQNAGAGSPAPAEAGLLALPAMRQRRGPGKTCLTALSSGQMGTIDRPINNSKGCGGIMRAAPAGLTVWEPFRLGCATAAITHGHPSGYLAAGFLAKLIAELIAGYSLRESIAMARGTLQGWAGHEELLRAVEMAITMAETGEATAKNVERLGQGWVAEEALAIALFSALKSEDFAHGVTLAVNHGGDSDSTGAITGNILGAMWGKRYIPEDWLDQLDLRSEIEGLAVELHRRFVEGAG